MQGGVTVGRRPVDEIFSIQMQAVEKEWRQRHRVSH